jgi:hypothetical protein
MNKINIKIYKLKEFPQNKVIINQSDEIRRIFIDGNEPKEIYQNLLKEIRLAYGFSHDYTLKLYWRDEEDDLVILSNDKEFQTAYNISNGCVRIYFIESNKQQNDYYPIAEFNDFKIEINKIIQKHPGVTCDGCRGPIVGIRYMCKHCEDYDLCENCIKRGVHQIHFPLILRASIYGFEICDDCDQEITDNKNSCKDCIVQKLPQMIKENKNSKIKYSNYIICDECKIRNHSNHSVLAESIKDIIISNRKILNEIRLKKSKNEEIKIHFGINCVACRRDGVSLRSVSFKTEDWFVCESCFVNGFYINRVKFILLSNEEAQHKRELQSTMNTLKLLDLKMKHDNNLMTIRHFQNINDSNNINMLLNRVNL